MKQRWVWETKFMDCLFQAHHGRKKERIKGKRWKRKRKKEK